MPNSTNYCGIGGLVSVCFFVFFFGCFCAFFFWHLPQLPRFAGGVGLFGSKGQRASKIKLAFRYAMDR